MKHTVIVTGPALRDMRAAAAYIAGVLKDPDAAERLLDAAEKAVAALAVSPCRHPKVKDSWLAGRGVRFFPVRNHIVVYAVRETKRQVVVLRFLYGRRDWISLLSGRGGNADDE
jgi:toxin ParE1/3/4